MLPVQEYESEIKSGLPTSASQYLSMVRKEASNIPNVLVATDVRQDDGRSTSSEQSTWLRKFSVTDIAQPPPHAVPRDTWACAFLSTFRRLQAISRVVAERRCQHSSKLSLPDALDTVGWRALCWEDRAQPPDSDALLSMDFIHVTAGIKMFDLWSLPASPYLSEDCGSELDLICGWRPYWLFGLLCVLDG